MLRRHISVLIVGVVAVVSLGAMVRFHPRAPLEEVLVRIEPAIAQLGAVPEGFHDCDMRIHNASNQPIEVLRVEKSCQCARLEIPMRTLSPGEDERLHVTWDLSTQDGAASTSFSVVYRYVGQNNNLEEEEKCSGYLSADVIPYWRCSPRFVRFSEKLEENEVTIKIEGVGEKEVKPLLAEIDHPAFSAKIDPQHNSVIVRCDRQRVSFGARAKAKIHTSCKARPIGTVSIVWQ